MLTPYLSYKGSRFYALASIEMHYFLLQDLVPEESVKWINTINGVVDSRRDFSSEESGFENLLVYM